MVNAHGVRIPSTQLADYFPREGLWLSWLDCPIRPSRDPFDIRRLMPAPLTLQAIHHVAVTTTDPQRSTEFYRDVLGFQVIDRPAFNFRGSWLFDRVSNLQIHVIEHPNCVGIRGEIDTKTNHFALAVPDLDQAEQQLQEHGIEYVRQVNAGGYQQIFFLDPDGNHIEVGIYPETIVPK